MSSRSLRSRFGIPSSVDEAKERVKGYGQKITDPSNRLRLLIMGYCLVGLLLLGALVVYILWATGVIKFGNKKFENIKGTWNGSSSVGATADAQLIIDVQSGTTGSDDYQNISGTLSGPVLIVPTTFTGTFDGKTLILSVQGSVSNSETANYTNNTIVFDISKFGLSGYTFKK